MGKLIKLNWNISQLRKKRKRQNSYIPRFIRKFVYILNS